MVSTEQTDNNNSEPNGDASDQGAKEAQPTAEAASGEGGDENGPGIDEISRMRQDADHYKDQFLRAMADMDNLKRRTEKEKSDYLKYGMETFFKDLLPVLDSFDKALISAPEESGEAADSSFKAGVENIQRQLTSILDKHGLQPIAASGEVFDPNVHQAIQKIDSPEINEETVAEEFARGYTLNGRLIRPSMVSVYVPSGES